MLRISSSRKLLCSPSLTSSLIFQCFDSLGPTFCLFQVLDFLSIALTLVVDQSRYCGTVLCSAGLRRASVNR